MQKLLFVVNNPAFFVSHRLEIGRAAVQEGYKVYLACPEGDGIEQIESVGINVYRIPVDRSQHGWFSQFRFMKSVLSICKEVRPDICHMVTLKTFLVAGFASKLAKVPRQVGSISGLGYLFISKTLKTNFFRLFLKPFFKWVMANQNTEVIFQNDTDKQLMMAYTGIKDSNTLMIRGSGVDLEQFEYHHEAGGIPRVVMASRLLKDKGTMEYLLAAKILKEKGVEAEFILAGEPDPVNPATVSSAELTPFVESNVVRWVGQCSDIPELFARAHIVVLPSYREGFPRVLIEAAACGRAVITTDVPGCRDAIIDQETGVLVPVKTVEPLSAAMEKLISKHELRRSMGKAGRRMAEANYSIDLVVQQHLSLYKRDDSLSQADIEGR